MPRLHVVFNNYSGSSFLYSSACKLDHVLTYGGDLGRSIIALLSPVWVESMPGADHHIDVLTTGAFFANGMSLVWVSSVLIRCMLKAYGKSFFGRMPNGY